MFLRIITTIVIIFIIIIIIMKYTEWRKLETKKRELEAHNKKLIQQINQYSDNTVTKEYLKTFLYKSDLIEFIKINEIDENKILRGSDIYYIFLSSQPRFILKNENKAIIFLTETIGIKAIVQDIIEAKYATDWNAGNSYIHSYGPSGEYTCFGKKLFCPFDMKNINRSSLEIMTSEEVIISRVIKETKIIREFEIKYDKEQKQKQYEKYIEEENIKKEKEIQKQREIEQENKIKKSYEEIF